MAQETEARSMMERARHGAFNRLDAQRERAATGLGSMVDALRESSRQLHGKNETMASYVDGAASQLERFRGGIRERDLNQIVRDVEGFARQRPAIFIGGAFALGLAAARFLKSSEPDAIGGRRSTQFPTRGQSTAWPTEPVAGPTGYANPTRMTDPTASSGAPEWSGRPAGTPATRR